ncbi:unnamed protein product [Hymenolepis diminuta]|uniref:Uncharacterized protein n=1 Tax=Hymenolepis diminuta TaxID=6216 RepID=A0A564Y6D4_HYMDI|nr:unnamed protein product [Hymenolepis diminuta]
MDSCHNHQVARRKYLLCGDRQEHLSLRSQTTQTMKICFIELKGRYFLNSLDRVKILCPMPVALRCIIVNILPVSQTEIHLIKT